MSKLLIKFRDEKLNQFKKTGDLDTSIDWMALRIRINAYVPIGMINPVLCASLPVQGNQPLWRLY